MVSSTLAGDLPDCGFRFSFSGQMSLDFDQTSAPPIPYNTISNNAGVWNVGKWDQAAWGGDIIPFSRWQSATGMGHYGTYRVRTSSNGADIRFYSLDYNLEGGGVL